MRPHLVLLLVPVAGWLYPMFESAAAIWECVDADGNKRFTNIEAESVGCQKIEIPKPSPRWTLHGKNPQTRLYLDLSSLSRAGANWKIWTLWDYTSRSEITLFHFNCSNRTLAAVQGTKYSSAAGTGDVVDSFAMKPEKTNLRDVTPDSFGELVLDVACKAVQARERGPASTKGKSQKPTQ